MAVAIAVMCGQGPVYAQPQPTMDEMQCATLRDYATAEQREGDDTAEEHARTDCERGGLLCAVECRLAHKGLCTQKMGKDADCQACFTACYQQTSMCRAIKNVRAAARPLSAFIFRERCEAFARAGCPPKKLGMLDEAAACEQAGVLLDATPPTAPGLPLFLQ